MTGKGTYNDRKVYNQTSHLPNCAGSIGKESNMNNIISGITKRSANLELLASLIASVGMIMLMINAVAGKVTIIIGIAALVILYLVQCLPFLHKHNDWCMLKLTLNHISLIVVLTGMLLAILHSGINLIVLMIGWILLGVCLIINFADRDRDNQSGMWMIQIRIFIIIAISLVFYLGF